MVTTFSTRSSTRISRAVLVAFAALFAALLVISRAALASGHGASGHGGSGHGGSGHGGATSHVGGGGSHGSGSHAGGSHAGGSHTSGSGALRGSGFRSGSFHGSSFGSAGFHRAGFHHRFRRFGFFPFFGFPFFDWGWGWGWAPYYSTWWWGGPSVYVAAGDDDGYGYGYGDAGARAGRHAVVKTDVSPEEAQIFLDGKYIGTADDFDGSPDYLYLGPGKYHVECRLPGYQTYATDLDVTRGQRVRLDEKLKLEPGKSALDQFPPEAKGTPLGRVFTKGGPEADDEATPAPRRRVQRRYDGGSDRDVAPAPRGYDGWSDRDAPAPRDRAPEARADDRAESLPRAAGNRARMRFRVTPEDAAVYVDDKYLGAGEDLAANPRGVVTDPGKHSITVTRPGYKSKTVDVTVRVGAPVDVVVELEK